MRIKSTAEQADQLEMMGRIYNEFSLRAVQTQSAGFLAHSGLLHRFGTICKKSTERSHGDFNNANHPMGEPLAMEKEDAEALATVLASIYGTTFASHKELLEAFVAKLTSESERLLRKVKGEEPSSG